MFSRSEVLSCTFIHGNALNFERMMSNIINNTVEAFDEKQGIVNVSFTTDENSVKIIIDDNGKGMLPETANKLMRGESVSTTKKTGYGIGTQLIESTINIGTKIILTIPKSDKIL